MGLQAVNLLIHLMWKEQWPEGRKYRFLGSGKWHDPLEGRGSGNSRTGRLKTKVFEIQAHRWIYELRHKV